MISISMAVALLLSLASSLLAGACMNTSGRASCHRVGQAVVVQHHCDGTTGHEEISTSASGDFVGSALSECPMSCCILSSAGKQVAFAIPVLVPPAIAVSNKLHSVSIVFTATGHSSHTNRGPPAA